MDPRSRAKPLYLSNLTFDWILDLEMFETSALDHGLASWATDEPKRKRKRKVRRLAYFLVISRLSS